MSDKKQTSRRDVLKAAGGFIAGAVVAGAIAGGYEMSKPPAPSMNQTETMTQTVSAATGPPKYTFYYVVHAPPTGSFWAVQNKGLQDAAAALNVNAVYAGATTDGDVSQQLSILEATIARKPDGIMCTISNVETLDAPLRQAIAAGIPVVATNGIDPRPAATRIPYLVYIGENSYEGGVVSSSIALAAFQKQFGRPPARAVFVNHAPTLYALTERWSGVSDTCTAAGVKVVDQLPTVYDPTKTSSDINAYLTAHPDTEYVAAGTAEVGVWAANVLATLNMQNQSVVSDVDTSPDAMQYIISGKIVDTVDQQPYLQAYYGLMALYLYKLALFQTLDVYTGPNSITQANAQSIVNLVQQGYR